MQNYIKESNVSEKLTGKKRKPDNKRFKALIADLNTKVEQYLNKVQETEEQARQAKKMGL